MDGRDVALAARRGHEAGGRSHEDRRAPERLPRRGEVREDRVEPDAVAADDHEVRGHHVPAEEIATALPLVQDGGVIEQRLDQEDLLSDEPAEALHRVEHAAEEAHARPDLPRGQAVLHGPELLVEIARRRAEQRIAAIEIAVDGVARPRRVGDLHERQLRDG